MTTGKSETENGRCDGALHGIRVLYMEDDPAAARLLQKRMQREGCEVDIAPDGVKGLSMYEAGHYDAVIVDQKMPVYDGLQVIRSIAALDHPAPAIMLTGGGDEKIAVEAMKLGASDYIVKDFDGRHLELIPTVLERVLERYRLEDEHDKLERQVQHAQKLESLGVLAGGVAHDFNNLLMGILGNADVALADIPEHSPALRRVTAIKDAAKRASDLCDHLLGYSGKGKFLIEMLNLNELVEEMANLLEVSISKKVNLVFDFCSRAPVIEADAAQVRQIVMNLITNASDAIGDVQGTIRLRTGIVDADWAYLADAYIAEDMEERTYAFIEVTDTGCGMDEQTRANIFDPFFTTKTTGRGLGLAAVLGIIRAHGGTIKLDSELGRGTVFTVLFPCSETAEPSAPGSDADTVADWQGKGTVLVIDDEDIVCDITRAMLEKSGFAAETAMNGEEGVQKFREHPDGFQAVLLDLTMPDMSGHEVYRAIREINTDIPVILSTGYAETDALENFDQADLAAFIHKPYDRLALIGALQNALKDE